MRDMQDKAGLPAEGYIYGGWVTSTYGADGATSMHGSVELMVTPEAKDVQTADNSSHVPSGERVDGEHNLQLWTLRKCNITPTHISPRSKEKTGNRLSLKPPLLEQ